ncbi:MAG: hypothetical protein LBV60_00910, partial [Streptomyces sp.]|nr:hypothetical protein [Streptomyces sp.]
MKPPKSTPLPRRTVLGYAAGGALALPFLGLDVGAAGTASAADGGEATLTALEERALALKPPAYLLESAVPPQFAADAGTRLSISDHAAVCGKHSLRWDHGPRSVITVAGDLSWARDPYRAKPLGDQAWQGTVDTFSVWIYNEEATDDAVRFEFGEGARTACWFEFGLDFTGWRTAWVRYAYDMNGNPRPGMDTLRIIAPRRSGKLWIDQLQPNVALRPDAPCRDAQVPTVGVEGDEWDQQHWQALYRFDALLSKAVIDTPRPSATELGDLKEVVRRYHDDYAAPARSVDDAYVATLTAQAEPLLDGRPVFSYQSQIYPPEISTDLKAY